MNDEDDNEFAQLIPGVKRMRNDRINVYRQRNRKPVPAKPTPREPDWQSRIPAESLPARDTHFNAGLQKKIQRRIKQGAMRPEASVDLHGCRQTEALDMLEEFVADALDRGMRTVLVIHGQGFRSQSDAVLKPLVQRWLGNHSRVLAWCPAQARDGAAGASYVYLRSS